MSADRVLDARFLCSQCRLDGCDSVLRVRIDPFAQGDTFHYVCAPADVRPFLYPSHFGVTRDSATSLLRWAQALVKAATVSATLVFRVEGSATAHSYDLGDLDRLSSTELYEEAVRLANCWVREGLR